MNLLKVYINSLPIEVSMRFGINKNVILNRIDIKDRLTKKGDISPKNFFMEFLQVDKDGDVVAREEFSFFKLNAERMEFVEMNFNDQFNKLLSLSLVMFNNDEEALDNKMSEVNNTMFDEEDGILVLADELFRLNSPTSKKTKKPKLSELKVLVEDLNVKLNEFFYAILKDKLGKEKSPKMSLLSVVDKKGYKQLPDEVEFVSLVKGELSLDEKYLIRKNKAEEPEVADEVGDNVDENLSDDVSFAGNLDDLDDMQDFDEIGDINDLEDIDY
jgi:hypothetical protein